MNIYHQSLLEGRPFLKPSTPDVSSDTITSSSELSALLQLVIPGSDVLFPPIDMARSSNYHPIEHPSPSFMYQLSALSLPISPQHQAPLVVPYDFWWGVASPAVRNDHVISNNVEVTYTSGEPLFDTACSWIEPVPFVFPDPVISTRVPHPNQVGALVTPLETPTDEFALSLTENDKKKRSQSKQPRDECEVAGCNTKKQSNGRCIRHGGGRRCVVEGCTRGAQTMGRCKRHGGGARCKIDGCTTSSQGGGLCRTHGGGKLCTAPGCKKGAQREGKCATHTSRKCSVEDCSRVARCRGLCARHKRGAEASLEAEQLRPAKRTKQLDFLV